MMTTSDIKHCSKVLCEIIMKRDPELFEIIRDLKLSAISNREQLSENIMENIRFKLVDWEINVDSFVYITSKENAIKTMDYLIETIQSDRLYELEKLRNMKETLSKQNTTFDSVIDCFESIPELLLELKKSVDLYNVSTERRVNLYKSLRDFAKDLYGILIALKKKLNLIKSKEAKDYESNLTDYMQQLLNLSIVIKYFPPRTIKKGTVCKVGTHFKSTISCLIDFENLFSREKILPYFIDEEHLKVYASTGEFLNECKIAYTPNNSNIWELKNMIWNPPKKVGCDRRRSEKITNCKAIIAFRFQAFAHPNFFEPLKVDVVLFSDTVISIVHTNQEIDAMITLFWDDYFRVDRLQFIADGLFRCKDWVQITELVDAVSRYFEKETSRGLTPSNMEFLRRKLFTSASNGLISMSLFGSVPMPDSSMSFGTWILSIIKLLKIPPTIELWTNGYIDGFMKKDVEALFVDCTPGTFALRFSEKNAKLGVLLKTPNNALEAWNPFSADECRTRNLCERLMDFHELVYIRSSNGSISKKEDVLIDHIPNKKPDDGYTERGQLSKILCSNIYSESLSVFDDSEDPFLGKDMDVDDISLGLL